MKIKRIHAVSPLSLLVLSACGGGSSSGSGQADLINLVGNVVNGPLKNALVFIDRNDDGIQDALEPDLRSGNSGDFDFNDAYLTAQGFSDAQITALAADIDAGNYSIVAKSDDLTVVNYGGDNPAAGDEQPAGGFTLSAPSGSAVVTPVTTLIDGGDLTADQVAAALGLVDDSGEVTVDLLTFNPFTSSDADLALQVEKTSMQVLTTLETLAKAGEGLMAAGEDSTLIANTSAVNAMVALLDAKVAAGESIDLAPSLAEIAGDPTNDITVLLGNFTTELDNQAVDTTTLSGDAMSLAIGESISVVNTGIEAITETDLTSDTTKNTFSSAKLLSDQVFDAIDGGNEAAITFDSADAFADSVANSTPTDIQVLSVETGEALETAEIPENEGGQETLLVLDLVDADENSAVVFEKVMVKDSDGNEVDVEGSDGALFEVVNLSGTYYLRLKSDASLDFESSDHPNGVYKVWVKGTDDGGKYFVKEIEIQSTNVNEAPALSETAVTAKEDEAFVYTIPAVDPEGDAVTFSVGELPSWLEFSSTTGVLTGTPGNGDVGEYSVSVIMTDVNGLKATETLTITVENVNDDPTFETDPSREATQDVAYSQILEVSDVDNEASDLTVTFNEEISADWLSFDPETNTLSGTPSSSDVSTASATSAVSLTLSDGSGGSEVLAFNITVANVNDAPVISDLTSATVVEGVPGETVTSENVTGTVAATDPDTGYVEESVTLSLNDATDNVKAGSYGSLTFDPSDNSYVYAPDETAIGALTEGEAVSDVFTFTATDSSSATGTATFTVNLTGANDKPVVTVTDDDLFELSDLGAGGRVGTLAASDDADTAAEITYALTESGDDNDNASFEIIDGDTLKLKDDVVTDRSTKPSYNVEIVATDSGGLVSEAKSLTIDVSAVNSAPAVTEFSVDVESGTLAIGDEINFTAFVSETVNEGGSFTVTLSNGASFDMTRSADSKTTLTGIYTVSEGDDTATDEPLSISGYSSGTVEEEVYADGSAPQALKSGSDTIEIGTVTIDATPPTASLDTSGQTYNAGTGTLTLAGSAFDTMGYGDDGNVKGILDFTKLTWNVDGQSSITKVMALSDIDTAVATDSSTLTIVLSSAGKSSLHNLVGFGGATDTGGTADMLNFDVGFLRDAAGNASSEQSAMNVSVAMTDQTSPTLSTFAASADADLIGVGDAITINLTFSEALRADSSASVVLSNGGTAQLTVSDSDAKVLTGSYVVSVDDDDVRGDTDLSLSSMPQFTVLDISGNVLSNPGVDGIDASSLASIEIDATPPEATISNTGHEYDASTGVLTVSGTNFTTMLDDPSVTNVVNVLDFSKLTWNVDAGGSVTMTMSSNDIASAVVTNATTLTITLTSAAQTDLHALAGFGGTDATGGTADGIDVAVGFLRDPAGNNSSGLASPVNGSVSMADETAPTISGITSATDVSGALGPDDVITFTAQLSEDAKAGSAMTLTLSNGATVSLEADTTDPSKMIGDYTVDADDEDTNSDSPLSVQAYSVGTTTDVSGNVLGADTALDSIDNVTAHVIDTTAPTAGLDSTGHSYNVSTGVLTLAGTNLTTLLDDPSDTDVSDILDFTKLTWNVNSAGSVTMAMTADDIGSAVVTNATTLTITLSSDGQSDLHALAGFGGTDATGGIADGLDVAVGFLRDAAGNESSGQSSPITAAEVTLSDATAPTITTITSTPSSAATFGVGDTITFTAQLSENIKDGTSMSITLSNDATVTLEADGSSNISGNYVVDSEDSDSSGLSIANFAVNTLVDLSGNALSDTLDITSVDNITDNKVDTTSARVTISEFVDSTDELFVVFNEAVTDTSISNLQTALRGLDAIADDATIVTDDNITTKIAVSNQAAFPDDGQLDVADFDVEDLAGNILTIETLDIA